jgi:puromycin-sensitive aminopeptidase
MEWWTHLWLNEGFASFMENLTTDVLYPEYRIWDQFVTATMIEGMKLDALDSSHPIEVAYLPKSALGLEKAVRYSRDLKPTS